MPLPINTLEVDCLLDSLLAALTARQAHDAAREAYDGWSWDYHGAHYRDAMVQASADFARRLNAYIEKHIKDTHDNDQLQRTC
jgi:hypothetical protein